MKLIPALLLFFYSLCAAAAPLIDGQYDSYLIKAGNVDQVRFRLETDFSTLDSCNQFGIEGAVRPVEIRNSLLQLFVADLGTIQTQIGCPLTPHPTPRKIHLESDPFTIRAISGTVYARVLVPHEYRLKMLP
jgi:hypothetical protein